MAQPAKVTQPSSALVTFVWVVIVVIVAMAVHWLFGWTYSEMGYGIAYVIGQILVGIGHAIGNLLWELGHH